MKERNNLITLFDYYNELLSDTQKQYFEDYYFNNLSLGEIADIHNVSRNAVHKQVKTVEEKLSSFEKSLKLVTKNNKLLEEVNKITDEKLKQKIIDIIES